MPRTLHLHPERSTAVYFAWYLAVSLLLGLVFGRAMFTRPDGIYTGVANNLGDLPFHLQVISSFAHGHNSGLRDIEDPTFTGARFTYPFLADYISALLVRCGMSLAAAMWLPNMLCALAFVVLLARWTQDLTGSRLAGLIAPLLVLFSGGLGWWQIFQDARNSDHGLFPLLAHLPHGYSIVPDGPYRWGNALTTLFVPQRSLLLGATLAIFIFHNWWQAIRSPEQSQEQSREGAADRRAARSMAAAGACAGLLPLIHTHTFAVVMAVAACELVLFRAWWRAWLIFFALALAISTPQVFWLLHGSGASLRTFVGWHLGWDHGSYNVLSFWLVNTGAFIPLLLIALLSRNSGTAADRQLARFYFPFLLFCFIVPNLIRLAPWVWDNIKVLFYWYLVSVPLVAGLLAGWLKENDRRKRWLAAGLLASLLLSGGLDVLRVSTHAEEYQEFDNEAMAMARTISQTVSPGAMILHAPTFNSPIFLTGRRSLLGYPGWAWSRGLNYQQREADIGRIYAGSPDAEGLLRSYHVDYALVGPQEQAALPIINDAFWARHAIVSQIGPYKLYRVRSGP